MGAFNVIMDKNDSKSTQVFTKERNKIMKKLSILVALILCVTIGGVYAVWTYTGDTMSTTDRTLSHGLATATTEGNVGVYKIVHNDIDIKIDQKAPGDYTANLVMSGSITVTFTPNDGAPDTIVNNAIPSVAYLVLSDVSTNLYGGQEIYTATNEKIALNWTKGGDGVFTATVTAEQLDAILDINSFELDTHAEYLAFKDVEKHIVITFMVAKA